MDTRMPAQGSDNTIFTPYTGVLPDNVSVALNAGISFFKIMCIGVPTGTTIFGFYDVDVKQVVDSINIANKPSFEYRWHRGRAFEKNNVRLFWDKKTQRSYAYIPDDPAWKNRMVFAGMMGSGKYIIAQYLTPKGLIDGAVVADQIRYIGERMNEFCVTHGAEVLFRSKKIEDATAFELKYKAENKDKKTQVVLLPTVEIQALIDRFGPMWLHKDEFVIGIRAKIEAEIDEKFTFTPQQPVATIDDPKAVVAAAFSMLTPQERIQLFQDMAAGTASTQQAPVDTHAKGMIGPSKIPDAKVLDNTPMSQLKELAEEYDIFTQGMQREDIIKELKLKSVPATGKKAPQPTTEVIT